MTNAILARIEALVHANPIVLFMKGTPQAPQCGFSAVVVGALDRLEVEYAAHDVLADPELRQGIKQYSEWPTIPQLYVDGAFVGGADIVREMYLSGELDKLFRTSDQSGQTPAKDQVEKSMSTAASVTRR
jgi:monothiol glutaredoxin